LVLTGAGGGGKTRLALQVAADTWDSFPDGGWWVELAPLGEGEPLGLALAGVLGVRPLPGRTPLQAAVDRLGTARALVVLDNCEQVLVAAAELAEALLRGCPQVVVLATSREPLGVPGESDWRVPSLALPDTDEPGTVARSDAGRLFVERAAKVRADFALGVENAASVAQVCRELDGIPLAIELASARARMLSMEQIADGLSDHFRLLTGGPWKVTPRQQTLRASVDWSYELLSEQERVLFRRLAVFVGSWSLEAVESVAAGDGLGGGAILDLLASLVDKSLVAVEEHGRAARYRLLETLRQYAVELLEHSGERPVLRDRHLGFSVALAERVAQELEIPRNWEWLEVPEPDAANFDAAIDHGIENDPERALRICVGLATWWKMSGRFAAGQNALARALDASDPLPRPLRARALWSCGHLARFRGDRSAVRYAQEALEMAESISDESTMARALHTLGALQMFEDPVGSRTTFARGLELARACGDEWLVMALLTALARSYLVTDDYDEAERVFGEAQAAIARVGVEGVTWSAIGLAMCAMVRAEHERCFGLCQQALSAARELGDPVTEAYAHALMARIENMHGRASAALARTLESETRVIANGAAMALPWTRLEQAAAYAALGSLNRAHELLEVVVAGGADSDWMLCEVLLALGDVLRVLGDADGARARACEALELSERLGARSLSAAGRELLARLAIGRDEWSEADALLHVALAQRVELGGRVWLPQTLDALAQVAAGLESFTEAARLLGAGERARSDLGLVRWSPDAPAFDGLEELLAEQLGSEAYAAARAEGAVMSLDEAIGWVRRARGTRKRPAGGWESLTPTERQVIELVSEGLTNPQVAERMFISRATVKVHLAHIFQKLDVRSRSELAARAVRRAG
jgi:predicted ATPase/DNA-binding CsgD family transcriptional regulator